MKKKAEPASERSRDVILQTKFLEDLAFWIESDRSVALRLLELIDAVRNDPFRGLGKPEPLRHEFAGCWSRRLTQEHRVIFVVTGEAVRFLQGRYHY